MKNIDRTIKAATLQRLEGRILSAHFELQIAEHTISSYFGQSASLTKTWRSTLEQIRRLRSITRQSFSKKILN
jgi:hypothetical protein